MVLFCSLKKSEDIIIIFFFLLRFGVRDLDAPQTCKKDWLGRDWLLLSVCLTPSPPVLLALPLLLFSQSRLVVVGWCRWFNFNRENSHDGPFNSGKIELKVISLGVVMTGTQYYCRFLLKIFPSYSKHTELHQSRPNFNIHFPSLNYFSLCDDGWWF